MNQRTRLLSLVTDFCQERGSRTFTLQELNQTYQSFQCINIGGKTPQATVRRLLQELRNNKSLSFLEQRGAYSLRNIEILDNEVEDSCLDLISKTPNLEKKEYIVEVYARNRGWVKQAKEVLGCDCLYPQCKNRFLKEDNTPYIEVHHIIPLYQGGDDGIWNLSVVCAHHHKMAHYANAKTRLLIESLLLKETECRI